MTVTQFSFRALLSLLLTGSTVALAGCSFKAALGSQTLDPKEVETSIKNGIAKQIGIETQSVSCPKDVKIEANLTFQCQVNIAESAPFAIAVTQKDDQGNVHWKTPSGLVLLSKVEQEIQQGVQNQIDLKVAANCGSKVKVVRSGETFECQVTDPKGKTYTAKVTATNDDGEVTWKI